MNLTLPSTNLQISVAQALAEARKVHLRPVLTQAVKSVELSILNRQLDENAPPSDLKDLASKGIRGEQLFLVPCILEANPRLIGYYRLLLGFSQKELYNKGGLGRFSALEAKGVIPPKVKPEIPTLCRAFCMRASELVAGLGAESLSTDLIHDLTVLTLGPQLRGSHNTKIGKEANVIVFDVVESIVADAVTTRTTTKLELENAAGRKVVMSFSADPDISVCEQTSGNSNRNIIAIEIKGGADQSNIWNRLGEAEKSHQTAKQRGFVEFWTIYNVADLNLQKASEKSPTTHRFYSLPELAKRKGAEFEDFRDRIVSLVGIRSPKKR